LIRLGALPFTITERPSCGIHRRADNRFRLRFVDDDFIVAGRAVTLGHRDRERTFDCRIARLLDIDGLLASVAEQESERDFARAQVHRTECGRRLAWLGRIVAFVRGIQPAGRWMRR